MSFDIGQKIICIDDDFSSVPNTVLTFCWPHRPTKGHVYTIRQISESKGKLGLLLHEIVNPQHDFGPECEWGVQECGFLVDRFRSVNGLRQCPLQEARV